MFKGMRADRFSGHHMLRRMTGQKRCILLKELSLPLKVSATTDMAEGVRPLKREKP
jgi:hypothetical protein